MLQWEQSAVCCSESSKTLICLTGEPDFTIICWKWLGGTIVASDSCGFTAHAVTLNPWDNTQINVMGPDNLNQWHYVEEERLLKAEAPVYHVGLP
jgi:acetyl-CoA carboxylase carboxyltransferase component